jgi:hypothetical protein
MARFDKTTVLEAARHAYQAGLTILPTRSDGSKAPAVATWAQFKDREPTPEEYRAMHFDQAEGLGVVAGQGVECWDFDDNDVYQRFVEAASVEGLAVVVDRIRAGYEDATPRGGRRWIVRLPAGVAWKDETLAGRPQPNGKGVDVLIELPTFAVVAPSNGRTHPSGKPYERLSGGFDTLATLTSEEREQLIVVARRFDERPRRQQAPRAAQNAVVDGHRPGDDFNHRATWPDVLLSHGWQECGVRDERTFWTRPGKDRGVSATTNHGGSDLLYVFSSSTSFEADRAYDKFAAYAVLNHGGDFATAARTLASEGYGTPRLAASVPSPIQFTGLNELLAEPEESIEWVVENRVPRGGLVLLAGKPKAGKSTLARDLAFQVATGGQALGCRCTAGPVWYVVFEDKRSEVKKHFGQMGATGQEPVRFVFPQRTDDLVGKLQALAAKEKPILIIIDTLQRLIGARDLNDYAEVTTKLTPILSLARESGAAVVLVHHAGKGDRAGIDAPLGSTALAGSVDNVLLYSRTEKYRLLSSIQRIGPDLPELVVTLHIETGRVSLGGTRHDADVAELKDGMLSALKDSEGLTETELSKQVEGRSKGKREAIRALLAEGKVERHGAGKRRDPYLYTVSPTLVPIHSREQETEKRKTRETSDEMCLNSRSRESAFSTPDQTLLKRMPGTSELAVGEARGARRALTRV